MRVLGKEFFSQHREIAQPTLRQLITPDNQENAHYAHQMIFKNVNRWREHYIDSQKTNVQTVYPSTRIERTIDFGAINIGTKQRLEIWQLSRSVRHDEKRLDALSEKERADELIKRAAEEGLPDAVKGLLTAKVSFGLGFEPVQARESLTTAYEKKIEDLQRDIRRYPDVGKRRERRENKQERTEIQRYITYYGALLAEVASAEE